MIKDKSIYFCVLLVLIVSACTPSLAQTEVPAPTESLVQLSQSETVSDDVHPIETSIPSTEIPEPTQETTLELSTALVRGCDRRDGTDPELKKDDMAVEFSLVDVDGNSYVLSELLEEKPVLLIYGSYT
jgi:hypothetical protein